MTDLAAKIEAADKATFLVGKYDDGSGPKVTVEYDTTSQYSPECIWLFGGDAGSDRWVAFDWRDAEEICATILKAAAALRAREAGNEG